MNIYYRNEITVPSPSGGGTGRGDLIRQVPLSNPLSLRERGLSRSNTIFYPLRFVLSVAKKYSIEKII